MRGVPIGSPSRSGYALRLGARIRPTALRSFLPKPESETSLSSVVTSAGGQTNHSPQSEGVARTTGGTRRRPLIDPLWVGLDEGCSSSQNALIFLELPSFSSLQ